MEKCKYCEYGEDNKYLFYEQKKYGPLYATLCSFINSEHHTLFIGSAFGQYRSEADLVNKSQKIKYCPICGRKLQGGAA